MTDPDDWITRRGLDLLHDGRRAVNHARYLMSVDAKEQAEAKAREALGILRSAMNWLEDSDQFEVAHQAIDAAGRYVRSTFGCELLYENGTYYQTCPVALAHHRIGLSPAMVINKSECSICHQDPEDCRHINGHMYDGEVCHRIITDVDVLEVSLVDRPLQPDARVMKQSIDMQSLLSVAPPDWQPGMQVNCDKCLRDCDGVVDFRPVNECNSRPPPASTSND
jgi:hypothetical protein